ncbi:MAG: reverse transcriptase family protein [Deltaproteobacteria bacterium]|jgi:RNA-directed DNA polymerase
MIVVAQALARAFLASDWTKRGLLEFGHAALLPPAPWLPEVVDAVHGRYRRPPRFETLWRFVHALPAYEDAEPMPIPARYFFPATHMHVPRWPVRSVCDVAELARWLEMPLRSLEGWADVNGYLDRAPPGPLHHYVRYFAGARLIEAPKAQLAKIQRRILRDVLESIPVHPAAHAYVRGRSHRTNAAMHVGRRLVLRFDLRRFFPSIFARRVRAVFMAAGYPETVAELLTGLTTTTTPTHVTREPIYSGRHLPQGAPSSPYLANLVAFRLDVRLAGLADRFGATYTRYADDLVFSSDESYEALADAVAMIVADEGFTLHRAKTRWMRAHRRQTVTGLVVNAHPAVSKRERKRLEATLFNLARDGGDADARDRLRGRIAHVAQAHAAHGRKLLALFERIDWSGG